MYIEKIPIQLYICKTQQLTFSLLPYQLVPYSKYPIKTTSKIMGSYWKFKNITKTLENICSQEDVIYELLEIGISQIYQFIGLFKKALRKYIVWNNANISLEDFIKECGQKTFRNARELAWDYYCANGGYEANSHFLFGTASQFRLNSS